MVAHNIKRTHLDLSATTKKLDTFKYISILSNTCTQHKIQFNLKNNRYYS